MKLTVQTVADRTKIKLSYITGMEAGDLAVFDAPVYARNFVRTYARFLKIDETQILPLLADSPQELQQAESQPPVVEESTPMDQPQRILPAVGPMALILALVLAAGGFFYFFTSTDSKQAQEEKNPPAEGKMPGMPAADTSPAQSLQTPPVHAAQLRALDDVWVFWTADGNEVEKILGGGDVQNVTFSNNLRLRVGNSFGLKLTVDGKDVRIQDEKVFDRVFRAEEGGGLKMESPSDADLQRFRQRNTSEGNP